jgi:DNA polymerase III delta prime subunit
MSNIINSSFKQLNIHKDIKDKLQHFIRNNKIPNIIFYGPSGSGKKTLVFEFISSVYNNDKGMIKSYVMYVNCAQGKGIKFIREDLKFFAKTHINVNGSGHFKSVILSNADQLTIDAQSALRRCIELFSHSTRFFVIVEDKYKLLKPILSRFCEIYIQYPEIKKKLINLHEYGIEKCFLKHAKTDKKISENIKKLIDRLNDKSITSIMNLAEELYEKGYSGLDLINYIRDYYKDYDNNKDNNDDNNDDNNNDNNKHNNEDENNNKKCISRVIDKVKTYQLLLFFENVKKDFRNEKLFITFILNYLFIRSDVDLENVSFM